jgi:hypothetical protein
MHGRDEKNNFYSVNLKGRDHFGDVGIDGNIIME